ncbi:MAG: SMP-30/gluconolactonase/LRE family protein [Bacteroidales bacterium]|jgi:gluconolactonase|nr:SMP-30/gluconolactonase/LRE family protein [Bacteroidales bacterium]MDD2570608.1 SMP-30/gluconolactonase/LRE family protein [Bacteroidales bacterium]MDD2812403.1 SMP-30/gluconolactonase/LRE family protein [Bacteroidales bacterium]MDD3385725.1 SMP-30/gluconolactonase/LRE family protein [Bacteroidales bacterium]MDD3810753.1 SMP-30/gluconolactonase/LRE family protein [Bacteroidales bacterium]
MKISVMILITTLLAFCQRPAGLDRLIQPGAQLECLADTFLFTEGPAADQKGNIYFTDQPNDRILLLAQDGKLTTFRQPSGRSNGLYFDQKGNLWACADEQNALWKIATDGTLEVIKLAYQDKNLNGPNDLWISNKGVVYLTDPWYPRPWWSHTEEPQELRGVYRYHPTTGELVREVNDMIQPNGIVGSPDGHHLYVADIGDNKTWRFHIRPDGSLTNKSLFCELGSDGMTLDRKGNLYLTGQGVTVFNHRGRLLGNIPVPESWTSNVCFGGENGRDLYITASTGIYRMRMESVFITNKNKPI